MSGRKLCVQLGFDTALQWCMIIYTEHDFEDDIELGGSSSVLGSLGQVHITHWPRAERKLCAVDKSVSVRKGGQLLKLT